MEPYQGVALMDTSPATLRYAEKPSIERSIEGTQAVVIASASTSIMDLSLLEYMKIFNDLVEAHQSSTSPMHRIRLGDIRNMLRDVSEEETRKLLTRYMGEEAVEIISRERINPKDVYALLSWIEIYLSLKKPAVDAFFDPEEGFQFLEIYLSCNSEEEWDRLERIVKDEMDKADLSDLTGEVAIVCPQVLQELISSTPPQ